MTPVPGTTVCAAMFGAVSYLAVRQYRFERLTVIRVRQFEDDMYAAVKEMGIGQQKWAKDTVRQIEHALYRADGKP